RAPALFRCMPRRNSTEFLHAKTYGIHFSKPLSLGNIGPQDAMPDVPHTTDGPLSAAEALKRELVALNGELPFGYHAWLERLGETPKLWSLQRDHLKQPALLVEKLKQRDDPFCLSLRAQLAARTAQLLELDNSPEAGPVPEQLVEAILAD